MIYYSSILYDVGYDLADDMSRVYMRKKENKNVYGRCKHIMKFEILMKTTHKIVTCNIKQYIVNLL